MRGHYTTLDLQDDVCASVAHSTIHLCSEVICQSFGHPIIRAAPGADSEGYDG